MTRPEESTSVQSRGFRPVHSSDARVLILGTLPGPQSLALRQYYGNPANAFWPIMGRLVGAGPELAYPLRLKALTASRVAVWDVCQSACRVGALDADIDRSTIVPNDFARFLQAHPDIGRIFFNGQKAEQLYRRLVLPELPASLQGIARLTLPSTSPAYAAMRFEGKLERWQAITA